VSSLATRRLIDAASTLDPAERALLNIWVNRGLGDARLAQLAGLSAEALDARRARIVERLGSELGLPPAEIRAALAEIAAGSGESVAQSANPEASAAAPAAEVGSKGTHPTVNSEGAEPSPDHRRVVWTVITSLFVVLVVASSVALATTGGGGGAKHRTAVVRSTAASNPTAPIAAASAPTVPAPAVTDPITTRPSPARLPTPTGGPAAPALGGLPGGLGKARGSIQLAGPPRQINHLRLRLRVTGLPAPRHGHYEVWLYNSVLDSRPLGRLRAGTRRATYKLARDARRYRWIDISFQPVGAVNHSGESELRASNPEHTTKARLRKRSARNRHQLRRATRGSSRAKTSK
jgi:hypothetical protein